MSWRQLTQHFLVNFCRSKPNRVHPSWCPKDRRGYVLEIRSIRSQRAHWLHNNSGWFGHNFKMNPFCYQLKPNRDRTVVAGATLDALVEDNSWIYNHSIGNWAASVSTPSFMSFYMQLGFTTCNQRQNVMNTSESFGIKSKAGKKTTLTLTVLNSSQTSM